MKNDLSFLRTEAFRNHSKPVTRRDFMSFGLAGLSGMMIGGLGLNSLLRETRAHANPVSPYIPFIVFDLAGGAALPGNFLVGKSGGPDDLLSSYNTLGWDPRLANSLDRRFGIPMAAGGVSQILKGILETTSIEAQEHFKMGSLLHFSRDDTSGNPLSIASLVWKAGLAGNQVPGALGSQGGESGGNSQSAQKNPLFQALEIRGLDDLSNAVGAGVVLDSLPASLRHTIVKKAQEMSETQSPLHLNRPNGNLLREISAVAYSDYYRTVTNAVNVDPRQDPIAAAVYGLDATTPTNSEQMVSAIITSCALQGICGPAVITIPGCDYHDSTQTTGDLVDLQIGRSIGRAVELAHRFKRPLMIQILTDGGIYAKEGTRIWQGDSGDRSMSIVGFYHPNMIPEFVSNGRVQIGAYTDGQGVDRSSLIGSNPASGAYAAFANYLSACGKIGQFSTLLPGVFTSTELESTLLFA